LGETDSEELEGAGGDGDKLKMGVSGRADGNRLRGEIFNGGW